MASYILNLCASQNCKLMTWMDTFSDQLLDMTIPCLSTQMQSFSTLTIIGSPIHFLLVLIVKFFERDMIGKFNGTVSNMNRANIVPFIKK